MADPGPASPARRYGTPALRLLFLVAVGVFAWLGLRGRFDEVADALRATTVVEVAGALALVLLGLSATSLLWLRLMSCLEAPLPLVDGAAIFFIGQLGKYIPGSVWSIGAQADLARKHTAPARVTVAAGLLFLGYHVDTAVILGSIALLCGKLDSPWPDWVSWLALIGALVGLLPAVVRFLGQRIGGRLPRVGLVDTAFVLVMMTIAWAAYAVALVLLFPGSNGPDALALGGAFAAAYAVGVLIVFAPAGLGAREGVFVLLLTPATDVATATALALLARVVHTAADGLLAGGWWWTARRRSTPRAPAPR